MYPNQSLHTWPPKTRRTRMRFPVASQKTALSTTRGRDYRGRDSIRQWKQEVDTKYRYVLQTVNAQTHGDKVTVRARVTGEFPGSPVELDHIFKLSNDKIASLEIRS